MIKNIFTGFGLVLLIAGCASITSDIRVETDTDPKINIAAYDTYAWLGSAAIVYDPEGKWEPPQFDSDAEIKILIDRELRKHGMSESTINPDLIVAYAAGIDMTSIRVEVDPDSKLQKLTNVPLGALTVVLVDGISGRAIWAGIASAEIQQDPSQEEIKKRLDFAVTSMFKKLPK